MIDRDDRLCSLCGEPKYQGGRGYLVQFTRKTWGYLAATGTKTRLFPRTALFHAYHEVTLGPQAKARLGLEPDHGPITVGELQALEMQS